MQMDSRRDCVLAPIAPHPSEQDHVGRCSPDRRGRAAGRCLVIGVLANLVACVARAADHAKGR
jgi:hypothetical protein